VLVGVPNGFPLAHQLYCMALCTCCCVMSKVIQQMTCLSLQKSVLSTRRGHWTIHSLEKKVMTTLELVLPKSCKIV
jgi:hypothetical protein